MPGDFEELYSAAAPELRAIAGPTLEFATQEVNKRGVFLPFGAVLHANGDVSLHMAAGESDRTNSTELLPLLHKALRVAAPEDARAVVVCEWVKVTPAGARQTDAAKLLVEHASGITVAFYFPMCKKLIGGWELGELITRRAKPEVGVWSR